jgi:hypothetical protein
MHRAQPLVVFLLVDAPPRNEPLSGVSCGPAIAKARSDAGSVMVAAVVEDRILEKARDIMGG